MKKNERHTGGQRRQSSRCATLDGQAMPFEEFSVQ